MEKTNFTIRHQTKLISVHNGILYGVLEQFNNIQLEGSVEEKYNKIVEGIIFERNRVFKQDTVERKKNVPWWSEECKVAIR